MYKVAFILHGKSLRKKRFYKQLQQARQELRNIEFNVVETSQQGHATSLASEFITDGFTHIIAVGGDGTLHEAINGIIKNYTSEVVLGLLPFGTANDFIKSLSTPTNLADLFEAISKDKHQLLDIGKIEHEGGVKYFLNIADIGIGAEVVKRVNSSSKWFGSNFTFFTAIIRTFFTYKNVSVNCKADDWEYEGKVNSIVAANGKYFGSGLCIAPNADPSDGSFSVVISGDISISDYLKNVNKIKKAQILDHPQVQYKTAKQLELTSNETCGIEADGEYIGQLPATISIDERKIKFLVM
ncbi:diacylglycerol/lipid kinase family protein [Fulvivirga lutea]|uniref:Diacylglycerol kinase family lipid kinase n=1 Tax=Fulvivirga lutea TaxID=2810512 RepID=A0A974WGB3_9BACT|nr:diacylglycerol kinase family protein [Fulvivirga lutea]QSE97979.1 diacylglycerol kinase family lipid kinase [Fulvivirga lutea]